VKQTKIISNELALQTLIGALRKEFAATSYLRVTYGTDKPRSVPQNSLVYAMYGQISREHGLSEMEVRRECKLRHGVPILRADDPEFQVAYDAVIKPLAYPQKLVAMDFWPVTSRMTTDQLTRFVASASKEYGVQEMAA
jgi:hypothetical protein